MGYFTGKEVCKDILSLPGFVAIAEPAILS